MDFTEQVSSFIPAEDGFTTLNDIELEEDFELDFEQGEMSTTKLSIFNPLYKEIVPSTSDKFYLKFFQCLEDLEGEEKSRYDKMEERFRKFFIQKEGLEKGERWNKRIEPDYTNAETYPLSFSVMIYGVDYLSNRDIKKILGLQKDFKNIRRINWSNAVIIFSSKAQLEEKIKPLLYDNEALPFFKPKQEEQESIQKDQEALLQKLPRSWYGLRPYEYKEEYIFWFVRYLTSTEPELLGKIKQTAEFMETYNASKKMWQRKQKNKQNFQSSINTSRLETLYRSQKDRSINGGSQKQKRERSREKYFDKQIESQNLARSNVVLSDLYSNQNLKNPIENVDLNQSHLEQMSFVYNPHEDSKNEVELKKKSDEIIQMFEFLSVNGQGKTLENVHNVDALDLDEDMEIITQPFDPKGVRDSFYFERKTKIGELTQLKPEEKFNYRNYVDKILQAEEETKEKRVIPVIVLD